jgi:mannose-6-phosphate isomerase
MKQSPAFKDYIWGGERLVADYGKRTGLRPVAESWELSCHPDGPSTVENGLFAGQALERVLREHPEFAGTACAPGAFPVLVKLIDAKQNLSLQVHPDDAYAREHEDSLGKNEMWYVADCEPGASLILGFGRAMGKGEIAGAIKDGSILDAVNAVPVSPGDCFCVPAGMLHAIGAGIVIAEIQQSSNVTYRVCDYGRTGADGKPRPLHAERAADVIDTGLSAKNSARGAAPRRRAGYAETVLADWRYFRVSRLDISAGADSPAELCCGEGSFHGLLVIDGGLSLSWGAGGAGSGGAELGVAGSGDANSGVAGSEGAGSGGADGANSGGACQNRDGSEGEAASSGGAKSAMPLAKGDCVFVPAGMGAYGLSGAATALLVLISN